LYLILFIDKSVSVCFPVLKLRLLYMHEYIINWLNKNQFIKLRRKQRLRSSSSWFSCGFIIPPADITASVDVRWNIDIVFNSYACIVFVAFTRAGDVILMSSSGRIVNFPSANGVRPTLFEISVHYFSSWNPSLMLENCGFCSIAHQKNDNGGEHQSYRQLFYKWFHLKFENFLSTGTKFGFHFPLLPFGLENQWIASTSLLSRSMKFALLQILLSFLEKMSQFAFTLDILYFCCLRYFIQ